MPRYIRKSTLFMEVVLFLCFIRISIVKSNHNTFNRKTSLRDEPIYIQRPDYLPEYDNMGDSRINNDQRNLTDEISEQSHSSDNSQTQITSIYDRNKNTRKPGSQLVKKFTSSRRNKSSNYRRYHPRDRENERRRTNSLEVDSKRRDRQHNKRRLPDSLHTRTTTRQNKKNARQYVVDRLFFKSFKSYKDFHDKTISSCRNGTNYMCNVNLKMKTIQYFSCIPFKQRCDGIKQCPLGDDETNCELPICEKLQVRCREGTCATVCNGIPECDQLEDELFCGPVCIAGQLRCPDGNCATVCDGKNDCKNKEDERNCKENLSSADICEYGEVLCPDRMKCAKICDGIPQCEDGADEKFIC